ncbi:MAG TPA: histidine phosphatase family protein, partial [bacterium]|nr:histidine phosphatase family protein [bacterium]
GRAPESRLTALGREQALRLGQRLAREARVQAIVSSSLPRALETARLLAGCLGLPAVQEEAAFIEMSKGEWEGRMPRLNVPPSVQRQVDADPLGFQYPGGESFLQVEARVLPAFAGWMGRLAGQHVLLVLHGDVLSILLRHLLGLPPAQLRETVLEPCSLTEFARAEEGWRLLRLNDTAHLSG